MLFKNINITYLNGKNIQFNDYEIFINHNDEDNWVVLDKNSVGSYSKVLLRFRNKKLNNEFYTFLESVSFIADMENIDIKTFSSQNFYKKAKKTKNQRGELAELKKKMREISSNQHFGWIIDEVIEMDELENSYFICLMKNLLNIEEVENYE
ncbi:MSC_0621 family F1-like ATPase epsilon subunit [Mycoplasmopsis cynos]|uniref:Uncharacterized protein n=1 Tax=Mycoplasmopsis cynos (strain C142) TaxID=1246955 RepID=L0RXP6_MYCC1|nr:hypothetical protein [Mycoplasmopsis cynos]UWV82612.1 hypothetical protein NW067_06765 [Mycoplasmopsis cynos]UWV93903.1 hypothetical protein NW062_01000 [Mycoplasmopsis cynos]WAM03811.1 hypothetical protein ONA22_02150 [Mycoplasmopsis cynos]WAM06385.1 hypothetical protein ONA23_05345 [Mycoplasmopsis cynos]WAM10059.1 hypothetical protein ONA24_02020 [Mycoplasmopsis cynos]